MRHFGVVSVVYLMPLWIAGVGCKEQDKINPTGMKFSETYGPHQEVIVNPAGQPPVMVGKVPLAYMVDYACTVRVMNVDDKSTLTTFACKTGEIILVDGARGVVVGDRKIKAGPLSPAARFGIFLEAK